MATATVNPTAQTNTERFDVAFGFETSTNKEGKEVKEAVVLTVEAAEKLGTKFEGSSVTVSVDYPSTFDSLVSLANTPANDDEGKPRNQKEIQSEIVKLFVNGAKSKVMNRLRAQLTKTDDKGVLTFTDADAPNGILDLTSEITSGSKRVFLSEEQKMWKSLAMLPSVSKDAVWKAYLTSINKEYYVPAE